MLKVLANFDIIDCRTSVPITGILILSVSKKNRPASVKLMRYKPNSERKTPKRTAIAFSLITLLTKTAV
jgi:hypothetical protein